MSRISRIKQNQPQGSFLTSRPLQNLTNLVSKISIRGMDPDIDDSERDELFSAITGLDSCVRADRSIDPGVLKAFSAVIRASTLIADHDAKTRKCQTRSVKGDVKKSISGSSGEISNLEDQVDQAKEDGKNEAIKEIAGRLSLQSSDIDTLVNDIEGLVTASAEGLVKNIVRALDLSPQTTSFNIVPELQQKMAEMITSGMDNNMFSSFDDLHNDELDDPSVTKEQLIKSINNLRTEVFELREQVTKQDDILQIFSDIPMKTNEIDLIVQSSDSFVNKIKKIVSVLTINIFASEDVEISNAKLLALVSGLFRFITSIGSGKGICSTIYSEQPYEEMRGILLNQAEKIQLFLGENAMGIVQDHCLFEDLIRKDINSAELVSNVRAYISEYSRPASSESKQLFVILMEAITAADILRKYSEEARKACSQQAYNVRQLKDYSKQLEKSLEDTTYLLQQATAEQPLSSTINATSNLNAFENQPKSNSHSQSTPGKSSKQASVMPLSPGDEVTEVHEKDEDYIHNLQNQINELTKENEELKKNREEMKKQTQSDLHKVQEQIKSMKARMNKKITKKTQENKKITKALKDAANALEKSKNEQSRLSKELEQAKNANDPQSEKLVTEIKEQLQEACTEHEKVVSQMKQQINDYQENKQREYDAVKSSFEEIINAKQTEIDVEKEKARNLMMRIGQLENEVKEKEDLCETLRKNEEEALDQAAKLSKMYTTIHNDFEGLEQEKKTVQAQLETAEKAAAVVQGTLKSHAELLETLNNLKSNYDKDKEDSIREMQHLLSSISKLFPDFTDLSVSLTPESVLEMLTRVQSSTESLPKLERRLKRRNNILKKIKEVLHCAKDSQIYSGVVALVKQDEQLRGDTQAQMADIKALQDSRIGYLQVQDWLIRIYVLITGGVCQDVTTSQMQHTIEDTLISSYENLLLSRKNAILRAEKKLLVSKIIDKSLGLDKENDSASKSPPLSPVQSPTSSPSKSPRSSKKKKFNISIRHILIIFMVILKTKKLSGHYEGPYAFETFDRVLASPNEKYMLNSPMAHQSAFGYE